MNYKYVHGGNIYDDNGEIKNTGDIIDFSANVNPLGMPDDVIKAAQKAVLTSDIYPDSGCRRLISATAEFENLESEYIICSNGASDILFRFVFAVKPRKILVTAPSYLDYERAGIAAGAETIYYTLKKENNFDIGEDIIAAIEKTSPDIVFICNPNNPTGRLATVERIRSVADICRVKNCYLLVDECFLDFANKTDYTAKSLISEYKNLIILKAFTKIFAMPGLRLGYAICSNAELIDKIKFHGADWAVSNIAQTAGIAALEYNKRTKYTDKTVVYVKKERDYLTENLKNAGFIVYPASANFIFFQGDNHLCDELRRKNILIRDCGNYKGLEPGEGYYRTAVLTKEKNIRLIQAVESITKLGVK
jgi:histidinol-phosphate aminotransferase